MKLFPALPVLWYSFLLLRISQGEHEDHDSDLCTFSSVDYEEQPSKCQEIPENTEAVVCVVSPTNMLNCSWSFPTLEKDAQVSVSVSISDSGSLVDFRHQSSAKRVGFMSWRINDGEYKRVDVNFNVTLRDTWICCFASFEEDMLNILAPPANVFASIQNGNLSVTWNVPSGKILPHCFDYQLEMGDSETVRNFTDTLQYMMPNVAPAHTYKVRMRTRVSSHCYGYTQWSEWSPTLTVEQPLYRLDPLIIAVISLGIPMILLAVLLILRHQRLVKILFPPIPRPPAKYKHFMEKTDPLSFFHPVPTTKPEEEITEVEDAEQNPRTTN